MKRRDVIARAVLAAASASLVAGAAREQLKVIAVFAPGVGRSVTKSVINEALQALGWAEGRNIQVQFFDLPGDTEAMRAVARAIQQRSPDVVLAGSSAALAAIRQEISSVPIVFVGVSDPVGQGFIASLAKPGGMITGFTNFEPSMGGNGCSFSKRSLLARFAARSSTTTTPRPTMISSYVACSRALATSACS